MQQSLSGRQRENQKRQRNETCRRTDLLQWACTAVWQSQGETEKAALKKGLVGHLWRVLCARTAKCQERQHPNARQAAMPALPYQQRSPHYSQKKQAILSTHSRTTHHIDPVGITLPRLCRHEYRQWVPTHS